MESLWALSRKRGYYDRDMWPVESDLHVPHFAPCRRHYNGGGRWGQSCGKEASELQKEGVESVTNRNYIDRMQVCSHNE